jgi:hypothetical protein
MAISSVDLLIVSKFSHNGQRINAETQRQRLHIQGEHPIYTPAAARLTLQRRIVFMPFFPKGMTHTTRTTLISLYYPRRWVMSVVCVSAPAAKTRRT